MQRPVGRLLESNPNSVLEYNIRAHDALYPGIRSVYGFPPDVVRTISAAGLCSTPDCVPGPRKEISCAVLGIYERSEHVRLAECCCALHVRVAMRRVYKSLSPGSSHVPAHLVPGWPCATLLLPSPAPVTRYPAFFYTHTCHGSFPLASSRASAYRSLLLGPDTYYPLLYIMTYG